jgi:ribosomal protein L25 (general stress protein Ctc)
LFLLPAAPLTLQAELRGSAGSIPSNKLRKGGRTPGIVFSGPGGEQQLLAFESKGLAKLVLKLGRTAWACSVFELQIQREDGSSDTVRALVSWLRA